MKAMLRSAWLLLQRECLQAYRCRVECINPLLFFVVVTVLFPLATTPNPVTLKLIGPGVIWVAALLATLLSLNQLFQKDYNDGSLEQLVLNTQPLPLLILVKVFSHWLMLGLPVVVMAPLIGLMFHLSAYAIYILMISLLIGTPILSLIGAIMAALTVGLRNSGLLLALILLPFYVPTLIFGASCVIAANEGLPIAGQLALLGALLALSMTLAPMAAAFALRVGVAYE